MMSMTVIDDDDGDDDNDDVDDEVVNDDDNDNDDDDDDNDDIDDNNDVDDDDNYDVNGIKDDDAVVEETCDCSILRSRKDCGSGQFWQQTRLQVGCWLETCIIGQLHLGLSQAEVPGLANSI